MTGDKEDGQDENEQQGAAVQSISDPGQSDEGVLEALGNLVKTIRGRSEYRVRCSVQCDKWLTHSLKTAGAGLSDTEKWLESWSQVHERTTCARLLAHAIPWL